ncbi:hypothetical protein V6N13_103807 [Hibiscus sabdariffa]
MAESDNPLTDAEKKASEERVLQNKELKEELILLQRDISAQLLNVVNQFEATNRALRAEISAALSENAKLQALLSLREQETDVVSVSYGEIIEDAKKILEMVTKHA